MSLAVQSYLQRPFQGYHAQKKSDKVVTLPILNTDKASVGALFADKYYNQLSVRKSNVAFKGASDGISAAAKVSSIMDILKPNEVLLVSSDLKKGKEDLKNTIKAFPNVLKKVYFIEDKKADKSVAFTTNGFDKEVVNLNKEQIFVQDGDKEYWVNQGESVYILEGNVVKTGNTNIPIDKKAGEGLSFKRNQFAKVFDFKEKIEKPIGNLNLKLVDSMLKEGIKPPKKIMFNDVGGQDNAIKELKKTILFPIKYPESKGKKNMRHSVLLYGPPGTGKSLLAEALANEADASFYKINASELDSKYVGESEANWRKLFEEAAQTQPSIIFIDEFDAIAKKRGGHDVYGDKVLNTILGLMSHAEKEGHEIYMLAATNNQKSLDDAATRSGRFGVQIEITYPDLKGTKQILGIHTKGEPIDETFEADKFAEKLHKAKTTGADIAVIVEEARVNAFEREGIYDKMEDGTFEASDMDNLTIKTEDFDKALETFTKKNADGTPSKAQRPAIGFLAPQYKQIEVS